MSSAADKQRTVVVVLTTIFVLFVVVVSITFARSDESSFVSPQSASSVQLGPLGNGSATCQQRQSPDDGSTNFVIVLSLSQEQPTSLVFEVELLAENAASSQGFAQIDNIVTADNTELPISATDGRTEFVGCELKGIQDDKRVLVKDQ